MANSVENFDMPMTEKELLGQKLSPTLTVGQILEDDRLAGMISNYLDGELHGRDLEELESLLRANESLMREINEMRQIERQLGLVGADILDEPVPEGMLEILSELSSAKSQS